jgi:hypothetical protein
MTSFGAVAEAALYVEHLRHAEQAAKKSICVDGQEGRG